MPRIIAVDFDGTIVEHRYPKIGALLPDCVRVIRRMKNAGFTLILLTMRSDYGPDGPMLSQAVDFCRNLGIEFDFVNNNPLQLSWTTSRKVYAHLYIDDAALGCPLQARSSGGGIKRPADWISIESALQYWCEERGVKF